MNLGNRSILPVKRSMSYDDRSYLSSERVYLERRLTSLSPSAFLLSDMFHQRFYYLRQSRQIVFRKAI